MTASKATHHPTITLCKDCLAYDGMNPDEGRCHRHAPHPLRDRTCAVSDYWAEFPIVCANNFCLDAIPRT